MDNGSPKDESYAACVRILKEEEKFGLAKAQRETVVQSRREDAKFMQDLAAAKDLLMEAQAKLSQLEDDLDTAVDGNALEEAKANLADAKWEFPSANLIVSNGTDILGRIKRTEAQRSISWSAKAIEPYVNPTTLNKMKEELRPSPKVSLEVILEHVDLIEKPKRERASVPRANPGQVAKSSEREAEAKPNKKRRK